MLSSLIDLRPECHNTSDCNIELTQGSKQVKGKNIYSVLQDERQNLRWCVRMRAINRQAHLHALCTQF